MGNRRTDDHGQVDEGVRRKASSLQAGQRCHRQDQLRPDEEVRQDCKRRRAVPRAFRKPGQQRQMRPVTDGAHAKKDQTKEVQP